MHGVARAKCVSKSTRVPVVTSIIILLVFLLQQETAQLNATQVEPKRRHVPASSPDLAPTRGQAKSDIRCSDPGEDVGWSFGAPPQQQREQGPPLVSKEQERLLVELGHYFNLNATNTASTLMTTSDGDKNHPAADRQLPHLPRPSNLTVLILSWYPPILKLSWNLNELDQAPTGTGLVEPSEYDFYQTTTAAASALNETKSATMDDNRALREDKFDLELALDATRTTTGGADKVGEQQTEFMRGLRTMRKRHELVEKSLACFQVTYNIVNSRFRVIEEYPAHLRSIQLERVQPATEYNLRVSAVYLNGRFRRTSERVQFVTPTDNESRRFKENTYRPIHSYPDELREPLIGLAQVRCEELTLVGIALFFWLATICLFFNKWGKIRMLEPYQPAYREQLDAGVSVGPSTPGPAQVPLGSAPGVGGGSITPGGGGGGVGLLNVSSSSYNIAHSQHQQLVAQSSIATTAGGRHTPSLTSECSRVAAPLCHVVDSLCMAAPPPPPPPTTCHQLSTTDESETTKQHTASLLAPKRESLSGGPPAQGPMSKAAAAARKSSMMILCNQRFGGPVGGGVVMGGTGTSVSALEAAAAVGLPKGRGRTTPAVRPDLNYLFQSKAQALAKASLWWPEAAAASAAVVGSVGPVDRAGLSAQKFKQGLYRAKFGSAGSSGATTDFETLRRLGKCLAARRQLTRPSGGGGASSASRLIGPLEQLAAAQSCDVTDQKQQQTPLSDPQLRLLAQIRSSRQRAQQRLQQQQQQQQAQQEPANSNKSQGVSFESSVNQEHEPGPGKAADPATVRANPESQRGTPPCERSVSSGGHLVTRFIRRNHAVDLTSPRESPRDSFRAGGTQSLDQSTSDSLALLQAAERKLATCLPSSCTVEEEEEEQDEEDDEHLAAHATQEQPDCSDNRMRRLQFLSKLHQHQQIAQSVSSTTLSRQHQAYELSSKANSLSLDSREYSGHQQPPLGKQQQPVVESTSSEQQRKGSKPSNLELVQPPEHHILIEPPSPPNNKFASPPGDGQAPSPLPPPAEFCTSPGSLETLGQQARPSSKYFGDPGPSSDTGTPGMRASTSAFAMTGGESDAFTGWQQSPTQVASHENAVRASRSETGISSDVAQHQLPRLEICLNDHRLPTGAVAAALVSSTSDEEDDVELQQQQRPLRAHTKREDAFAKLADSYRASTERRLACARSFGHLSSLATATAAAPSTSGSANYCPCGGGACCISCHEPVAHQSHGADTDQVAVCGCQTGAGPSCSRLFSIGQHAHSHHHHQQHHQQRQHAKRVRQCSHCGSIECASQQAAMALHQMCALRNKQQQQQQVPPHARQAEEAAGAELGAGGAGAQMRPRMSSVFAACPTYARSHRDSFAMLRALSQRRSKSAEDIAYLSSLVLQIWAREPNPLLQSASQLQLNAEQQRAAAASERRPRGRKCSSSTMNLEATSSPGAATMAVAAAAATTSGADKNRRQSAGHSRNLEAEKRQRKQPRSSLTVANL